MACSQGGVLCLRVWVVITAILIWLIGGAIFGFSLWLIVDFFVNEYLSVSEDLKKFRTVTYIFLSAGAFLVVYSVIGIAGAVKPKIRCLLIFYLICLALSIILLIGGTVWCYVYRHQIKIEIEKSDVLKKVIQNDYGKVSYKTRAFDFMQSELRCCGGESYDDYKTSDWIGTLFQNGQDPSIGNRVAPLSCCKDYFRFKSSQDTYSRYCLTCKGSTQTQGLDPNYPCPEVNDNLWQQPCNEAIVAFLVENLGIAAGVVCGIFGCQLIAVIFAALLLYNARRVAYPSTDDDVVYEMARCQEKSPYPTRGPYANLYNN